MRERADVVVVGAGFSGLTTAVVLQRSGRQVHVITADDPAGTTSMVAAAVWFPTEVGPRHRVVAWGRRALVEFERIAENHPGSGVVLRETISLYRDDPGRPWWTDAVGQVEPAAAEDLPPGYRHGLRYVAPLAESPTYLPWLVDQLTAAGGTLERRRLASLEEVTGLAPVVVNCTGLGARELVGDDSVEPIRGQVVRTTNPGITVSVRDHLHPGGYAYVHPRSNDCVLGGTLERGSGSTRPDPSAGESILARCRELVPALADAQVLEQVVGLRPGRPTVRLELEPSPPAGATVVHNYGHGGAGMTLSWGCAAEVAALVSQGGG